MLSNKSLGFIYKNKVNVFPNFFLPWIYAVTTLFYQMIKGAVGTDFQEKVWTKKVKEEAVTVSHGYIWIMYS